MSQQDISDSQLARARIDGGFSFALAAFAIGLGLLALLERVGLPDQALRFCVGAMIFAGLVVVTARLRTMRPAEFYAGGRNLPAAYAALAYAGLASGLFLPFLPPLPQGVAFSSLAIGFMLGLFGAVCVTGPYLRRGAAFSIADLVGSRFAHPLVRCAIALIAAVCAALVALAGTEIALRAFISATGASQGLGIAILGILLILLIVPGGLSGTLWLAAGAAIVTLTALGLPPALSLLHAAPSGAAGASSFETMMGARPGLAAAPSIVIALTLGLMTLAPLFGPSVASQDRKTALRSGPLTVIFVGLIAALTLLSLSRAAGALDAAVAGQEPGKIAAPILAASARGQVELCGTHSREASAIAANCGHQPDFANVLRAQDIHADGRYLLENLPSLQHLGPTLAGLAAIFAVTLGIAVAAAGVQSFATSLGHDIYHPRRRRFGPVTRRLAFARALTILLIVFCGYYLAHRPADPRSLVLLALTLSGTLVAPVLALTLVKRATSFDAAAALLVAAALLGHFFYMHRHGWQLDDLCANAAFAALDGLFAGLFASLLHGREAVPARPALPAPGDLLGPD